MQVSSSKTFIALFLILTVASGFSQKPVIKETTVYVFLSETCPICQNYTLTLKELYSKYKDQQIRMIGIFPNHYSTQKEIDAFRKQYSIPFPLTLDADGVFTKHFKAEVTPEVFVEDKTGKLIYSGRIDDTFYAIGKRRTVITSNELADTLEAISKGKEIKNNKTQAVGCIISATH